MRALILNSSNQVWLQFLDIDILGISNCYKINVKYKWFQFYYNSKWTFIEVGRPRFQLQQNVKNMHGFLHNGDCFYFLKIFPTAQ